MLLTFERQQKTRMRTSPVQVIRRPEQLGPDDNRVISRFFELRPRRIRSVLERILGQSDERIHELLPRVWQNFATRHDNIRSVFLDNYEQVAPYLPARATISTERQLIIGAYFTMEYSIESAALFNPSIVMHPNQADAPAGSIRFLMSLRATGEGHLSSIVFRRGLIDVQGGVSLDPPARMAYSARPVPDNIHHKALFFRKLLEMKVYEEPVKQVLAMVPEAFTRAQLYKAIEEVRNATPGMPRAYEPAFADMVWLAKANYELRYSEQSEPVEIVIFPATEVERRGMEDLRLAHFVDEDGTRRYYGTYTAFDGTRVLPMLLETSDFRNFHVGTLNGKYAKNKGMALFPRKVNGKYLMVSRHDGENLFLLASDNIYVWKEARRLMGPRELWEVVQLGNCGSPLETEQGWILLTHGVGPMRMYCIGAVLLDLHEPWRIIGRLRDPLLVPTELEREGYVPNVVYSCGAMLHNNHTIIPYAMSDSRTSFAVVRTDELIDQLLIEGP
jgi:predicted GH43/DUF377 family glycosyl hydrolase